MSSRLEDDGARRRWWNFKPLPPLSLSLSVPEPPDYGLCIECGDDTTNEGVADIYCADCTPVHPSNW